MAPKNPQCLAVLTDQSYYSHLQAKLRKLKDFQVRAKMQFNASYPNPAQDFVAASPSVDPDESSLSSILLMKVAAELEQTHATGKFLEARVDRCDGHREPAPSQWAIFLSTPYLDQGEINWNIKTDKGFHRPRTLFEYIYEDQETSLQDAKQILGTKFGSSNFLRVHSLWALLFSSGIYHGRRERGPSNLLRQEH